MPESGTYGSVRGVPRNRHPYRDHYPQKWLSFRSAPTIQIAHHHGNEALRHPDRFRGFPVGSLAPGTLSGAAVVGLGWLGTHDFVTKSSLAREVYQRKANWP